MLESNHRTRNEAAAGQECGFNGESKRVASRNGLAAIKTCTIAVLPGDGIGIEVTAEAVRVLQAVAEQISGIRFELQECPAGAREYRRGGDPLPVATLDACRQADAVFLGAMGLPSVRWPDGREMAPQLDLREQLDLYCGLRPIRLYHEADTPLRRYIGGQIDLLIVRENTEGLFWGRRRDASGDQDESSDALRISRHGSQRLFRAAFREAQRRRGHVTLVDKANVLPSMVFFRQVFDEIAAEFPDVTTDKIYVDAAALYLVQRPHTFDVIVTENMFGDILSDLAAGLVGGMGMAPSADIGDEHGLFQPAHGSAPDIAGRGLANPVAAILSMAMLLEWLADLQTLAAAARIRQAVSDLAGEPTLRTPDLGGRMTTRQIGDAVLARL